MFDLDKHSGAKPKCYFTSSQLPAFLDHDQLPLKKKPFSTVLGQSFIHTLDVILPRASFDAFQVALAASGSTLRYCQVYMKLSDIVEGDFFNQYIKSGNVLMLSEGRPNIDRVYSLSEGVLRLEVDKATFERMGLEGKAILSEGRKHVKARFAVEINLRLPSMVRGKKGFERILWAFKNVLNSSVSWLFYDLKKQNDGYGPIENHQPKIRVVDPQIDSFENVIVPSFTEEAVQDDWDHATDVLEWLTLAMSGSLRAQQHDQIDSYLSRYQAALSGKQSPDDADVDGDKCRDLIMFHWHGFIPAIFIKSILLVALKASGDDWFAFSATAFDGESYAFLQNKNHTMTWKYLD